MLGLRAERHETTDLESEGRQGITSGCLRRHCWMQPHVTGAKLRPSIISRALCKASRLTGLAKRILAPLCQGWNSARHIGGVLTTSRDGGQQEACNDGMRIANESIQIAQICHSRRDKWSRNELHSIEFVNSNRKSR